MTHQQFKKECAVNNILVYKTKTISNKNGSWKRIIYAYIHNEYTVSTEHTATLPADTAYTDFLKQHTIN